MHDITVKLVPPENHRSYRAEKEIQTFKNNLLSMIVTADNDDWPLYLLGRNLVLSYSYIELNAVVEDQPARTSLGSSTWKI